MSGNTNAGFGLKPIRHMTGGEIRSNGYPIKTGYPTAIYTGDPVIMDTDGTLLIGVGTAGSPSAAPLGVFQGVSYTDASGAKVYKAYWPASTTATNIEALVIDDPDVLFAIQSDATGVAAADIGQLYDFTIAAGSTATGRSATVLGSASTHASTAHQLRAMRIVDDGVNVAGAYAVVEVSWAQHALKGVVSGVGGI